MRTPSGNSQPPAFHPLQRVMLAIAMVGLAAQAHAEGAFSITGDMVTPRSSHVATRMSDGRVLVLGGVYPTKRPSDGLPGPHATTELAEIYDPVTGAFEATSPMSVPRVDFAALSTGDGRVLVVGGYGDGETQANAELFDVDNEVFEPVAAGFAVGGERNAAVRLLDGRILVIGGFRGGAGYLAQSYLFDPETDSFSQTGSLNHGRYVHTATRLQDGRVLVTGGLGQGGMRPEGELYDPATGVWTVVASPMVSLRERHAAVLLGDGRVLVAGGYTVGGDQLATVETFDPATGTFQALDAQMAMGRIDFQMRALEDGRIFIIGGYRYGLKAGTAELFDPATDTFTSILPGPSTERSSADATLLVDGTVLIMGGDDMIDTEVGKVPYGEIYDPNAAGDAIFADGFDSRDPP